MKRTIAVSYYSNNTCKSVSVVKGATDTEIARLEQEQRENENEFVKQIATLNAEILGLKELIKEMSVQIKYLMGDEE